MNPARSTQEAMAHLAVCLTSVRDAAVPVTSALAGITRDEALELAEQLEQVARFTYLLQLHLARAVDESAPAPTRAASLQAMSHLDGEGKVDGPTAVECPSTVSDATPSPYRRGCDLLRVRLRISGRESRRRIRTAKLVLPRRSLTGEALAPVHPIVYDCLTGAAGMVAFDSSADPTSHTTESNSGLGDSGPGHSEPGIGAEAVEVILKTLEAAHEVATPETLAHIEGTLATYAGTFDPDVLRKLGSRVLTHLDPDGAEPCERDLCSKQGVKVGATWRGLTHLDIWADALQTETLLTVFDSATNPRPSGNAHAVGSSDPTGNTNTGSRDVELPEERTRAQVMLDGLVAACSAALHVGGLREVGGLPPQVMVTMSYDDLVTGLGDNRTSTHQIPSVRDHRPQSLNGSAHLPHAGPIPAQRVRHLACDADLIPIVLNSVGRVVDLGRSQRLVTPALRRALIARDGGCIFPGCALPSTWTEAHHIVNWLEGGPTSLDNLVLLCSHHHHAIHTRRWQITGPAHRPTITPVWASMPRLTNQPGKHDLMHPTRVKTWQIRSS